MFTRERWAETQSGNRVPNEITMHPVNAVLSKLGLRLVRRKRVPSEFRREFEAGIQACEKRGLRVFRELHYDAGVHPARYIDFECSFAAEHLGRIAPESILDVASYRLFILGLLAHFRVTTVDVRERNPATPNETVVTCDAKALALPDGAFDAVVSLCSIEHFGLGRYGDALDLDADRAAFRELVRVARPGGRVILSTTFTRGQAGVLFNAHRIYDRAWLESYCDGLELEGERFFSHRLGRYCSEEEVTSKPGDSDIYMGVWRKL